MDRFSKILLVAAATVVLLLMALGVAEHFARQQKVAGANPQQIDTGVLHIIALDINDISEISHEQLMQGENALLLYRPKVAEGQAPAEFQTFNGIDSLAKFDSDQSATIDMHDPVFSQLFIGIISSTTQQLHYLSIANAGIVSIHLAAEAKSNQPEIAYIVMSDGSHRAANILKIFDTELQALRPIPLS